MSKKEGGATAPEGFTGFVDPQKRMADRKSL